MLSALAYSRPIDVLKVPKRQEASPNSFDKVSRAALDGILYSGGRDDLLILCALGVRMKRRARRYDASGGGVSVEARGYEELDG